MYTAKKADVEGIELLNCYPYHNFIFLKYIKNKIKIYLNCYEIIQRGGIILLFKMV